jgi:hypothetical protein
MNNNQGINYDTLIDEMSLFTLRFVLPSEMQLPTESSELFAVVELSVYGCLQVAAKNSVVFLKKNNKLSSTALVGISHTSIRSDALKLA